MTAGPPPRVDLADRTTNELLAILEIMFLMATVDLHFSSLERAKFLESAESLSGGKLDANKLARLVNSWTKRDLDDAQLRTRELARDLSDETARRIAFGLAQGVADADGDPSPTEKELLVELAAALGISPEEAAGIRYSVRMSERPPAT